MKKVTITLTLDCRDNIPPHVVHWMAGNLEEHAAHEFGRDYDPDWGFAFADDDGPPPLIRIEDVQITADGVTKSYDASIDIDLARQWRTRNQQPPPSPSAQSMDRLPAVLSMNGITDYATRH